MDLSDLEQKAKTEEKQKQEDAKAWFEHPVVMVFCFTLGAFLGALLVKALEHL